MHRSDQPGAAPLRVLIVEADDHNLRLARQVVAGLEGVEVVGWAGDTIEGWRLVARLQPDLVLLEMPEEPAIAIEAAAQLSAALPSVQLLASAAQPSAELMRDAMRAGVRQILRRPLDAAELGEALSHARSVQLKRQRGALQVAEVITFFGAGGGLGTTTLAVNTAVALARQPGARVLLADLDLGGGDVPIFLDLDEHAPTFTELLARAPDSDSLPAMLATHRSGLQVLPGPPELEDLEAMRPEELPGLLVLCRGAYRQIVVDAGHAVDDVSLAVLEQSERIYLVTQMSLSSLQGAGRRLDLFRRLGLPEERFVVVLNRGHRRANLSMAEAERVLGAPIGHEIGSDYGAVLTAIDNGVPLVEQRRGRRVTRTIEALARRHWAGGEAAGARRTEEPGA